MNARRILQTVLLFIILSIFISACSSKQKIEDSLPELTKAICITEGECGFPSSCTNLDLDALFKRRSERNEYDGKTVEDLGYLDVNGTIDLLYGNCMPKSFSYAMIWSDMEGKQHCNCYVNNAGGYESNECKFSIEMQSDERFAICR